MGITLELPAIDERDRALFRERDPRRRADALRDTLVPKILTIHRFAVERLRDVYGCDPHEGSSPKPSISPDHRKDALVTQDFHAAYAGLVGRQIGGKYISPKLTYVVTDKGLRAVFWVNKSREAEVLDQVLRHHRERVRSLLAAVDRPAVWAGADRADFADHSALEGLPDTNIPALDRSWHVGLCGGLHEYPIDLSSLADRLATDYEALFPLYKAIVDALHGADDNFLTLYGRFDARHRAASEDIALPEGGVRRSYRQHRKREKRLRTAKLREALNRCDGRLRCEVPGCGFDFYEVYGEIGREFAHVHHLRPLGERDEATATSLDELAIVCANCHAMIHRDGASRPLKGLINRGESPIARPAGP